MSQDPFGSGGEPYRRQLSNQPAFQISAAKIAHARKVPVYDIGLFGNSRIMSVHQEGFRAAGRIFNFYIPGQSFRTSVALTERLAIENRLPGTLIVMVSHFGHNTQQVRVLPFIWRLRLAADDLIVGLARNDISIRELLRMTYRHIDEERIQFKENMKFGRLRRTLALALGKHGVWLIDDEPVQHEDGSGYRNKRDTPVPLSLQKAAGGTFLLGYFLYDLERLAQLPGRPRIIVYESPLEPHSELFMRNAALPWIGMRRQAFLDKCLELELECYGAPLLGTPEATSYWKDSNHPPDDLLIPYLLSLLNRPVP